MKYQWIKAHLEEFAIRVLCDVLGVCRAAYYAWRKTPQRQRAIYGMKLVEQIRLVQEETRGVYGSPRVTQELRSRGIEVCENTVARCMKKHGIRAKTARSFVPCTTESLHDYPVWENLLDRDFVAEALNQKWVCDITYIPTDEGWLYLAGVIDLFSRRIVGWSMSDRMPTQLVTDALGMAMSHRRSGAGLLHHSDRGVQYASSDYQQLLASHSITASMSRKGNCYDNAAMESFWGTLKTELVNHERYRTREEARASIFEYIEVFYNRKRRHSSLDYVSPEAFEASQN